MFILKWVLSRAPIVGRLHHELIWLTHRRQKKRPTRAAFFPENAKAFKFCAFGDLDEPLPNGSNSHPDLAARIATLANTGLERSCLKLPGSGLQPFSQAPCSWGTALLLPHIPFSKLVKTAATTGSAASGKEPDAMPAALNR